MINARKVLKSLFGMAVLAAFGSFSLSEESFAADQCKRKTNGYFLQYAGEATGTRLKQNLESIPVSLTGAPGDPVRGQAILVAQDKGDCLSCHQVRSIGSVSAQGGVGPSLDGIGNRYNDAQLRQIIVNPKAYFANTIMPSYYKDKDASGSVLTAAEVEDLLAYLKTLK